jgi:hypothetical protein
MVRNPLEYWKNGIMGLEKNWNMGKMEWGNNGDKDEKIFRFFSHYPIFQHANVP